MKSLPYFARVVAIPVLLGAHWSAHSAPADTLVDPTRPPSPTAGVPGGEKSAQGRTLQSVLIAPGRSVAVIDGEMVRVGGRLGDAEVVKIDESGVVLRSSGRMETLRLLPDAKRVGSPASRRNTIEERAK